MAKLVSNAAATALIGIAAAPFLVVGACKLLIWVIKGLGAVLP